jgi:hypothetical protein
MIESVTIGHCHCQQAQQEVLIVLSRNLAGARPGQHTEAHLVGARKRPLSVSFAGDDNTLRPRQTSRLRTRAGAAARAAMTAAQGVTFIGHQDEMDAQSSTDWAALLAGIDKRSAGELLKRTWNIDVDGLDESVEAAAREPAMTRPRQFECGSEWDRSGLGSD